MTRDSIYEYIKEFTNYLDGYARPNTINIPVSQLSDFYNGLHCQDVSWYAFVKDACDGNMKIFNLQVRVYSGKEVLLSCEPSK